MRPWPRWFQKFGPDLLSIIPFDAESDTIPKAVRGKCPGYRKADGKWVGTHGSIRNRPPMTEAEAMQAEKDGAGIGIIGRNFPALDIDIEDEALATEIEKLAFKTLGPAPVRVRAGSARRLLMYKGAGLPRQRMEFRHPSMPAGAKPYAIELLGAGQYYNVEGIHPSGVPYEWRGARPYEIAPFSLPEFNKEAVKSWFR